MGKGSGSTAGHVMTLDVGTSVIRVSAVSLQGEVLAVVAQPPRTAIAGDRAELDPGLLWSESCRLMGEIAEQTGQPLAVGVACQLGTVLVDETLAPIGPALLWQDARARTEAGALEVSVGDRGAGIAGRRVAPELAAPRALWFAKSEPAEWSRARWLLSLKDFIVARLTGNVATDPTSASYTFLFDVSQQAWSPELAAAAGVATGQLPPVLPADARCGTATEEAGAATGLDPGVPVAVGGPDGSLGALGSGACAAGVTVDVAGTTDVLLHTVATPVADPQRRSIVNAFLRPGAWTVGGPTGMTGGAVAWLCGVLGYESVEAAYRALGPAVAGLAPGAAGVSFRTALSGERFPTWAGDAAGSIAGLRPGHGPEHLLRAAEEGAAFTVRQGIEALGELGIEVGEIRISGGLSRRREAMQLRANAWGRPVVGVSTHEATTVGAAMVASVCGGAYGSLADAAAAMVRLAPTIEPDEAMPGWDAAYERWQEEAPLAAAGERAA